MSEWLDRSADDPDMEVLSESALAMAQATLQNAIDQSKISRADLARSMDTPRSFVTRMLSGSHNLTIKTMARCLAACGFEIQFGLKPIQWNWHYRGDRALPPLDDDEPNWEENPDMRAGHVEADER